MGSNLNEHDPGNFDRKLTLAFFGSAPGGAFNFEKWFLWRGIADAARSRNANIIYVAGEEIDSSPDSILYDLRALKNVDGIIAWGSFAGPNVTSKSLRKFLARFPKVPVVSIDLPVEGCSVVNFNIRQGLNQTLDHLISVHGYRRIAFIVDASHPTQERRDIFIDLIKERGLYDPCLVGDLADLETCGLVPGKDFEAVVAYTDIMAVEVIESLRARGYQVPEDVAVTGFNDGHEARGVLPPLTTVRLPFRWAGHKAVEMLVEQIQGHSTKPTSETIDSYLILRRSCGCIEPMAEDAAAAPLLLPETSLEEMLANWRVRLVEDIAGNMGTWNSVLANRWSERFLNLFLDELHRPVADQFSIVASRDFLRHLNNLLKEALAEGSLISRWQGAVSTLRRYLLGYLDQSTLRYAEDMMQQMRVLIAQTAIRAEIHQTLHLTQRTEILRAIESDLLLSSDFDDLLINLAEGLSKIGIQNFYMVLNNKDAGTSSHSRMAFAFVDGQILERQKEENIFPPGNILPSGLLSTEKTHHLVIEALYLRDEQLGYIVFDTEPPSNPVECDVFQALRLQLSSAIKGVQLREQLQAAYIEAEEANQLKSRFLSMVSHELRTPLNLIVGLSEMAMRQQARGGKASREMLQKFNEQIYVSGQHLDRLIRDVLDLASSQVGQMALMRKPLDLLPVLKDTAVMGSQLAQQKNLVFRAELPDQLPWVDGDKTRLRQVLLNLLSNAVKFTAHGEIVLSASQEEDWINISVRDTGLGIAKEEQERIFDEFQQTDRSMVRGYGGIGLGLAITRRLVELHGGKIWVSSSGAVGGGSTFTFTLPCLKRVFDEVSKPDARDGVVLILTNDENTVYDLRKHLVKNGFLVEELVVQEQPDFLDSLLASPPGAVVLDLAPASEQGWEIIKKLKENPATQDIPVLFFSLMVGQNSGAVFEMDYLEKPVGTDQLINALRRHGLKTSLQKGPRTVIIVDDEPGILELHSRMVQTELPDCRVLQANDGLGGLELMRREQPDLVLLDLMMPELDGFGVLKIMQEEPSLRGIPVIILSAQVLTRHEIARLNQGVAAVLGKGLFTTDEIMSRIQGVLTRTGRLGGEGQRLVHQAMAFLHERYKDPIARADVANHLNVNEQYLSRCFNREVGIGPMAYLSRFRIEQAKRLLEIGGMTITQVALEVGLSSQSYFSRLFYQETGITPSAYQKGERRSEK